jgi:hypothetical protein
VGFGVLDGGERTGFPDCRTISDFRKLHLAALQGFTFALVGMHQRSKRGQECVGSACPRAEKATLISERGLYLCRQRPTLPHTFACSTIGPAGLNFRVRDGNGWIPRGKITDKWRRFAGVSLLPESRAFFGKGISIRPLGVACERRTFKDPEDNASQLNRLVQAHSSRLFRRRPVNSLASQPSRF